MQNKTKILLVVAAVVLAACAKKPSDGAMGANAGVNGGFGAQYQQGSASDPRSAAYFKQTVGDRVLFVVNQSSLTPEAQRILVAQAQWLKQNPEYDAIIEGHADERGTREYNLALGARRASSVRDFLVSQGVAERRLRTISYGKERPIEVCSNEACYSQNRRAVTVVAAGAGV